MGGLEGIGSLRRRSFFRACDMGFSVEMGISVSALGGSGRLSTLRLVGRGRLMAHYQLQASRPSHEWLGTRVSRSHGVWF
jgi:hypothetical protein